VKATETATRYRNGVVAVNQLESLSFRRKRQAFPFYPIAEAENMCNRHIREFLPPRTNG